jgi:hypothetical protein
MGYFLGVGAILSILTQRPRRFQYIGRSVGQPETYLSPFTKAVSPRARCHSDEKCANRQAPGFRQEFLRQKSAEDETRRDARQKDSDAEQ